MKTFLKSTTSLILIIVFLVACFVGVFFLFAASWLHTYRVFTREKVIAEVTISEQMEDEFGPYVQVQLVPIEADQNALNNIFTGDEDPNPKSLDAQDFKLYGDTVYIGGPVLKFKSGFILLNFETAYKLNTIFARYDSDLELEKERNSDTFSSFEIGEGDTTYRNIAKDIRDDNLRGKVFKMFFDSEPQTKTTGIYVGNKEIKGEIVIRNEGFHWKLKEVEE